MGTFVASFLVLVPAVAGTSVGVPSEQDCMRVALNAGHHDEHGGRVAELTSDEVETIDVGTSIPELVEKFIDARFRHHPVLEDDRLVGRISRRDVSRAPPSLS